MGRGKSESGKPTRRPRPSRPSSLRPFVLVSTLTVDEREAVDTLKARSSIGDDADVVRLALWRLADHYELRLPIDTFAIGSRVSVSSKQRKGK